MNRKPLRLLAALLAIVVSTSALAAEDLTPVGAERAVPGGREEHPGEGPSRPTLARVDGSRRRV